MEGVELGRSGGPVGGEWSPESQSCGDHDYFEDNPSSGFGVELEVEQSSHPANTPTSDLMDLSIQHHPHYHSHYHMQQQQYHYPHQGPRSAKRGELFF